LEIEGFSDSDDESAVLVIGEVELVDDVGNHLKESASALSEVSVEALRFFEFADILHLFARLRFGTAARIANFERYVQFAVLGPETHRNGIFVEWHAPVFDGVVHEFVGNEREAVFPWNVDGIALEQVQYEVADHLRLPVIGLKTDHEVEIRRIGNGGVGYLDQVLIVDLRDVDRKGSLHSVGVTKDTCRILFQARRKVKKRKRPREAFFDHSTRD
jgi:hypothetical protein